MYQQNRDLISVGAYQPGSDAAIDEAINVNDSIMQFLQQDMYEPINLEKSLEDLMSLISSES